MNTPVIVNSRARTALGFTTEASWQRLKDELEMGPVEIIQAAILQALSRKDYRQVGKLTETLVNINRYVECKNGDDYD